ncbi:MAG: 50S ribosomal protein L15 [Candidatus Babeliaceae bacterium]
MNMHKLSQLPASGKKRKRVGRGGDKGGTSGRGHQGQGSRSGGSVGIIFEGGQMPLTRRLPKRGFSNNPFRKIFEIINLGQLNEKFAAGQTISREALIEKGLISGKSKVLVKLLGNGVVEKQFIVHVDAVSKSAVQAIEKHGGKVLLNQEM